MDDLNDHFEGNNVEIIEKSNIPKNSNDQLNSYKRNGILSKLTNNIVDTDDNDNKFNSLHAIVCDDIVRPQKKDLFISKPNIGDDYSKLETNFKRDQILKEKKLKPVDKEKDADDFINAILNPPKKKNKNINKIKSGPNYNNDKLELQA